VPVTDFMGFGVFTETWKLMYYPNSPNPLHSSESASVAALLQQQSRRPESGGGGSGYANSGDDEEEDWSIGGQAFLYHRPSDPGDRHNRFTFSSGRQRAEERSNKDGFTQSGGQDDDAWVSKVMLRALLRWRAKQRRPTEVFLAGQNGFGASSDSTVPPSAAQKRFERTRSALAAVRGDAADEDLMTDLDILSGNN
jgi:hypothetical protein